MGRLNLQGMRVLITGGTRGLGRAIGLEFAATGAEVFLTHRWGSVDAAELQAIFKAEDLAPPHVIECDASDQQATHVLMQTIKEMGGPLDVVISNVAFGQVVDDVARLKKNTLNLSIGYSAWPIVTLAQEAKEVMGRYPRYLIGISSNGGEECHEGYDLVGASKAILETLCRYLALRLKSEGVRVNAIRPGLLDTQSTRDTVGDQHVERLKALCGALFLDPRAVARSCVALCSGFMDSLTGQVITVDEGWSVVSRATFLSREGLPGQFPSQEYDR